jgi:hypothetical protein
MKLESQPERPRDVSRGTKRLTIGVMKSNYVDQLVGVVKQLEVFPVATLRLESRDEDDGLIGALSHPGDVGESERIGVKLVVDGDVVVSTPKGNGFEGVDDVAENGDMDTTVSLEEMKRTAAEVAAAQMSLRRVDVARSSTHRDGSVSCQRKGRKQRTR